MWSYERWKQFDNDELLKYIQEGCGWTEKMRQEAIDEFNDRFYSIGYGIPLVIENPYLTDFDIMERIY